MPIKYSQQELNSIIQDKEFIEVYQDFNLQYLKECVMEGREEKKEVRRSVKEFQRMSKR